MKYESLSVDRDGTVTLPCCNVSIQNPSFPIQCGCQPKALLDLIDSCVWRGEATGREVSCGCPSTPKQPVFSCDIYGEAVRHATSSFDGQACIACEYIRTKLTEVNDGK